MSFIVYGPQGCGKTHHSQALRAHFQMLAVLDDHEPPLGNGGVFKLLQSEKYAPQVMALNALILTCDKPPRKKLFVGKQRILSFAEAMKQAGPKSTKPTTAEA